jgi:hypothetical protein
MGFSLKDGVILLAAEPLIYASDSYFLNQVIDFLINIMYICILQSSAILFGFFAFQFFLVKDQII